MKKFLVLVFMGLFAVSAMAVDVSFVGSHQLEGRLASNDTISEDDARTSAYYYHFVELVTTMAIDTKATLNFRTIFSDSNFGDPARASTFDGFGFTSRVWLTYEFIDGLTLTLGRKDGQDYFRGFSTDSSNTDLIRVDYQMNDDVLLYAFTEKLAEGILGNPATQGDTDTYGIGADLTFNNLGVYPAVVLLNDLIGDERTVIFGAIAEYLPATGINLKAGAVAYKEIEDLDYMVFGGFADASWVAEDWDAGVIFAYGSHDEDTGVAFNFNTGWAKTSIMDNTFRRGDDGLKAMMQILGYADYSVTNKLALGLIGGVFMSTLSDGAMIEQVGYFSTEDTFAFEVDVTATYHITDATWFEVGGAYAMLNDVAAAAGGAKYDADPLMMVWWSINTDF